MKFHTRVTSIFFILILFNIGAIPASSGPGRRWNHSELGGSRWARELEDISTTEYGNIELLVQFREGPATEDISFLKHIGFEIKREFHIVPAISIVGPISQMHRLSESPHITYIEKNDPMVADMEMGTNVINATQVWTSTLVTPDGHRNPIDGTGVTVCVVDTGIDAGHPDLDYRTKTIFNVYDAGNGLWIEGENTDTNFGHGTHVAGTVAGNGDASAGARRGVAPGANLIGITVSIPEEATSPLEDGYIQGLEWVYDHSRPGANPYNIRCVTNSWHSTVTEYDPDSLLTKAIEKLTFENNVVSTWSAGNDGRDDPGGDELTTSGQGNTPVAIMVAAYERDGSAVTDFSSRGRVGANHTYPDVGAPGKSIWSCSARRTAISGISYVAGNTNPYYLAISGTSMSTPHVAGLVALLWQACPSLKISHLHEDYSGEKGSEWRSNPLTRIHEAEWILEASALFLSPTQEHGNVGGDTNSTGWGGKPVDYVQGYGIVDAKRAVGIALSLQRLREKYPNTNITVWDAIASHDECGVSNSQITNASRAVVEWKGEYSRYNDQSGNPLSLVNQTKYIPIPMGARKARIILTHSTVALEEFKAADLAFTVDIDGDGEIDHQSELSFVGSGNDVAELNLDAGVGEKMIFNIIGTGIRLPRPFQDINYVELRMEYDMSVEFFLPDNGSFLEIPRSALYSTPKPFDMGPGTYKMENLIFDTTQVTLVREGQERKEKVWEFPWIIPVIILCGLLIGAGMAGYKKVRKGKSPGKTGK